MSTIEASAGTQYDLHRLVRQQSKFVTKAGQDERKLADLAETGADRDRHRRRAAAEAGDDEGRDRLDQHNHGGRRGDLQRMAPQRARVEQHSDRDEEQHREGVLERQRVMRGTVAMVGFANDDAGEECSERVGQVE